MIWLIAILFILLGLGCIFLVIMQLPGTWVMLFLGLGAQLLDGYVFDAAEHASLRLTPPELASSPLQFRRVDGTSRFRPHASTLFSSEALLAAEDHLLARAAATTGPTVPLETVERGYAQLVQRLQALGAQIDVEKR